MAHFVKHRKQHIAGDELRESLAIFCRKAFVPFITGVRECGGVDPGLKLISFGRSPLRKNRPGAEHEDERQKQQNMPHEEAWFHGATFPCRECVLANGLPRNEPKSRRTSDLHASRPSWTSAKSRRAYLAIADLAASIFAFTASRLKL